MVLKRGTENENQHRHAGAEVPRGFAVSASDDRVVLKVVTWDCPTGSVPVEGAEVGGHSMGNAASTTSFTFMLPGLL